MNLVVCMKQVPDTAARVAIGGDGRSLDPEGVTFVVNPYDEIALEEALRIREKLGEGEVAVVTMGPEKGSAALRSCLAMGADRGIHLQDAAFQGSDSLGTARILAAAIARKPFDLILLGKQGVGTDNSQTGPMLAELLDLPHVNVVVKLEIMGKSLKAFRQIEGALEVIEAPLPAVVTAQKGLNEPRYAGLKGIMAAKKKPVEVLCLRDLGLPADEVGEKGALVRWTQLELPASRSSGKILQGEPEEAVEELVRLLREEAKVI
ncbi:MAG: electron transfer flavoprotein subunit beta/FixA family protein [Acidobacteria bacterium]|nr:electron transfer flavoprotein subunit beta/FixA family protein [Acidobacteriota bacterium]